MVDDALQPRGAARERSRDLVSEHARQMSFSDSSIFRIGIAAD
jgi:hypothetical protein